MPGVELLENDGFQINHADIQLYDKPNKTEYFVESVDGFDTKTDSAFLFCRYNDMNIGSAVAFAGKYKILTFGFPFEVIKTEAERDKLMKSVLKFFEHKKITKTNIE